MRGIPRAGRGLAVLALLAALCAPAAAQEYDVVIRNGRVLDGAGNPWVAADVAIRDGKFVAVGRVTGRGKLELDAAGRYVSPGWIDMMDQSGSVLREHGLAANKLRMGVTTAIGGEGGTPVPASDVAEYFRGLEESGISLNFGTYFSATQARTAVMGFEDRPPSAEELDRMRATVDTALRAGVMGITTALIYPPSSFHTTDELVELAKVAGRHGGIYATHVRGEGKELVTAVGEAITIGELSGARVEIFHLKAAYQPGWGVLMEQAGAEILAARARGVDIAADLYPYTAGGTGLEATVPSWVFDGGMDSARARLSDPHVRERLKQEIQTGSPGWWNIVEASGGWDHIVLVNARNPENARWVGSSIASIARELGKHPADAAWDLVLEGQGRVMAIYHMMSERDVRTALQFPWTSIGSDAGAARSEGEVDLLGLPHPRSYGTFPRIIARYVREMGTLTLQGAIRKMTSWPATRMGLVDRGVIREGMWADVVIFDFETIQDLATWDAPVAYPVGIDYVLVNGEVVIDHGTHTAARPGHVLYGPGKAEPARGR
jgi:N-acyl-D-aspartate/D-glutamate deacylase